MSGCTTEKSRSTERMSRGPEKPENGLVTGNADKEDLKRKGRERVNESENGGLGKITEEP